MTSRHTLSRCRTACNGMTGAMATALCTAGLLAWAVSGKSPSSAAGEKGDTPATVQTPAASADERSSAPVANRPKVAGVLRLEIRRREETGPGSGRFEPVTRDVDWNVSETAVIICDMWNDLYCKAAAHRINVMAPRMNEVITSARSHGVMIVHAPSGTMDRYEGTPYRRRMQHAPHAAPPVPLEGWCYLDPEREPEMPVDTSQSPCDDPLVGERVRVFDRQHPDIKIVGFDGVSDSGEEIYNYFRQEGIENVVLMGVHTNMCVLGRPFGIRQMVKLGMNVVLARDLTDAMYDPREYPYVSHTRGTELVVEHIEAHWCASILSRDLTRVLPSSADPDPAVIEERAKKVAAAYR